MVNEIHSQTGTHLNTLISDNDKEGGGQGLDRKTAYEREGKSNSVRNLCMLCRRSRSDGCQDCK